MKTMNLKVSRENKYVKWVDKSDENAGFDLWIDPVWFKENYGDLLLIPPGDMKLLSTGIRTAFDDNYVGLLYERGSTGTKCMSKRAGVIDAGFRGVCMFPINNTGNNIIAITSDPDKYKSTMISAMTVYCIDKAIGQIIFHELPKVNVELVSPETILNIKSDRGEKMLGSTNV